LLFSSLRILVLSPTQRYDEVLNNSHSDAIKIKAVCDSYIQTILPMLGDLNMSINGVKVELQNFIAHTVDSEKRALSSADEFDKLRFDLGSHKHFIYHTLARVEVVDPRVPGLENTIKELESQISEAEKLIASTMNIAFDSRSTGIRILLAWCPPLADIVTRQLKGVGESKLSAPKKLQSDLQDREIELAKLLSRATTLSELITDLQSSESAFQAIIKQVGALSNFWTSVRADCQGAIEHLNKVETVETVSEYGLKKALGPRLAGSVYIILSNTLSIYVGRWTK